MARPKKLCLNCGIEHVRPNAFAIQVMLDNGVTPAEIQALADQQDARTEKRDHPSLFEQKPAILAQIEDTGVMSKKEMAAIQAYLDRRHPDPQDDPSSELYVPEAFKVGATDPAIAQARQEAAVRARKARFAQAHPSKNAEYQRKHREKKRKNE